jgi:hypothetical protein
MKDKKNNNKTQLPIPLYTVSVKKAIDNSCIYFITPFLYKINYNLVLIFGINLYCALILD